MNANAQLIPTQPLHATCKALQELQVRRIYYIRNTNKITNAAGALVRRALGYNSLDEDKTKQTKIKARAACIVRYAFSSEKQKKMLKPEDEEIYNGVLAELLAAAQGCEPFVKARHNVEKHMKEIVRTLPAYDWICKESQRGFGELALAVTIGETGNLCDYENVGKLWKRLGLAPYEGKAASTWRMESSKPGRKLSVEEWQTLGFRPARLAEIYSCLTEPLLKHNRPSENAKANYYPYLNAYKSRYDHTLTTHPDWTKMHHHRDAMRYMTKQALRDMYQAWHAAIGIEKPVYQAAFGIDKPVWTHYGKD